MQETHTQGREPGAGGVVEGLRRRAGRALEKARAALAGALRPGGSDSYGTTAGVKHPEQPNLEYPTRTILKESSMDRVGEERVRWFNDYKNVLPQKWQLPDVDGRIDSDKLSRIIFDDVYENRTRLTPEVIDALVNYPDGEEVIMTLASQHIIFTGEQMKAIERNSAIDFEQEDFIGRRFEFLKGEREKDEENFYKTISWFKEKLPTFIPESKEFGNLPELLDFIRITSPSDEDLDIIFSECPSNFVVLEAALLPREKGNDLSKNLLENIKNRKLKDGEEEAKLPVWIEELILASRNNWLTLFRDKLPTGWWMGKGTEVDIIESDIGEMDEFQRQDLLNALLRNPYSGVVLKAVGIFRDQLGEEQKDYLWKRNFSSTTMKRIQNAMSGS